MSSCTRWAAGARPIHPRPWRLQHKSWRWWLTGRRSLHVDGRARLSNEWAPTGGIAASKDEDAYQKLIRAGLIRQSHAGIFQLLPLGLRVQDKITRIVDRHMRSLGASKVQLSAISSEALWQQSGRLDKVGSELFRFEDRREGKFLLSPTHEEEITSIAAKGVGQSYRNLPLRLYQITQKFRDELRPRHGLLRGRDFCMKDLYTFDYSPKTALKTYEDVRKAYSSIFIDELKLPVLVAKASSGDMGGDLSHEYHIPTPLGEDQVLSCNSCDYVANEEVAEARIDLSPPDIELQHINVWRGISKDRKTRVNVWYDASTGTSAGDIDIRAVKKLITDLDTAVENAEPILEGLRISGEKTELVNLFDCRLSKQTVHKLKSHPAAEQAPVDCPDVSSGSSDLPTQETPGEANFIRVKHGDGCPHCSHGTLAAQKAIELGHTFHLGTRYSKPLNAVISGPTHLLFDLPAPLPGQNGCASTAPMQMGCHGIGISRIIGAVANHFVDQRGLNWPRAIAPYEVVVVVKDSKDEGDVSAGEQVYDALARTPLAAGDGETGPQSPLDVIVDDRSNLTIGWKLNTADLVGYPVVVVVGKEWNVSARVEVQCRRLGFKELRDLPDLRECVEGLLQQL